MAELLVKAVSATHPDPIKDAQGCYKRGDIVDVRPDGFEWGKSEGLPNFVVIKVPGVDHTSNKHLMQPHQEQSTEKDPKSGKDKPVTKTLKRRLWNVQLDHESIPQNVKDTLKTTGKVTVTKEQIQGFIQNKSTSETWK